MLTITEIKANILVQKFLDIIKGYGYRVSFPSGVDNPVGTISQYLREDREVQVMRSYYDPQLRKTIEATIGDILFGLAYELKHVHHMAGRTFPIYYNRLVSIANIEEYIKVGIEAESRCANYATDFINLYKYKSNLTNRPTTIRNVSGINTLREKGFVDKNWQIVPKIERYEVFINNIEKNSGKNLLGPTITKETAPKSTGSITEERTKEEAPKEQTVVKSPEQQPLVVSAKRSPTVIRRPRMPQPVRITKQQRIRRLRENTPDMTQNQSLVSKFQLFKETTLRGMH